MSATGLVIKRAALTADSERPEHRQPEGHDEINRQPLLHLLPCKIHPNRAIVADSQTITAPVDRYFCPYVDGRTDGEVADTELWRASLRGKPLTGVRLGLPEGYMGVLCNGKVNDDNSEAAVRLVADDQDGNVNQQLMYWNWDRVPTRDDPLLAALNWIHVSEAIMSDDN